jgi:tetratricopeptide (TPR) repeat protein
MIEPPHRRSFPLLAAAVARRTATGLAALTCRAVTGLAAVACCAATGVAADPAPDWIARIDSLRIAARADSALAVIARALPVAESAADSTMLLGLWLRQGELLTSLGFAREGEVALRKARSLAQARADTAGSCVALRWLSVAVESQGRGEEAAQLCRTLLSLAQSRGDRTHEAWARVGLAWNAETVGRDEEAWEQYRLAAGLFRQGQDLRGEAWARNGLGNALAGLGRYAEARKSYQAAVDLAGKSGYRMVQGLAANNLGTLEYSLGDPGAAVDHFRHALLIRLETGNVRESIIPGINLALCNAELGRLEEASDSLEAMLAVCRDGGYAGLYPKVINQLARTRRLQGRHREANLLYRSTIALGSRAPMKNRVEAVAGLAESLGEVDSSAVALPLLERMLASIERGSDPSLQILLETHTAEALLDSKNASAALPHLRTAIGVARRYGLPEAHERAWIDLGRAWRALDRPDSAAAAWEAAARLWEEVRGAAAEPEWREARGAQGRSLCTGITESILGRDPGSDRIRRAYDRAQRFKTRTLLERMQGPGGSSQRLEPTTTIDRLQKVVLEPNELLLDFFLGPENSYLFAVTEGSCRVTRLPPETSIASTVLLYHDLLRTPPRGSDSGEALRAAGRKLHATLFAGMEDLIQASERTYVSPDGVLNLIPFGDPDETVPEWVRLPSATVLDLLRSRTRQAPQEPERILALAGDCGPAGELRGVAEEVGNLARRYRGTDARFLERQDTIRLADLGAAPSILHVASHSEPDDQRPWLSRIDLGGGGWRAGDIAAAHIPSRLAVLSSCQSQHGKVLSGEGTLGLSTALLCAGPECVVATLWPVEDRATARFMRAFYAGLSEGRTVAGAIQGAQASFRRDARTSHPFYWAGFVVIGRGETRVHLQARRLPVPWPAAVAAGAALLAVGALAGAWRSGRSRPVIPGGRERLMG